MSKVPRSRLLVHAHRGAHRDRFKAFFADGGIDPARIEFVDGKPLHEYYDLHNQIDIALDPFPYAGGTTTCDALWMGVPVISLVGKLGTSRAGLSLLSNVGLPELAVSAVNEYIDVAAALAGDLPRLSALRESLRSRMTSSPLTNAREFTSHLENAFRSMWQAWCETQHANRS